MDYLIWLSIFTVLALLATIPVHLHLTSLQRKTTEGRPLPAVASATQPCPRCSNAVPVEASFCTHCGVPMMLWALKRARAVSGEGGNRVVPIINQDVCIGCSACVDACDQHVLQIVAGKSAVIRVEACTSAGSCAAACPTGACQLGGSGAARRVEVPELDDGFQTSQAGIYAIGELGGLGLIKNAIIEGQLVIDRIAAQHRPRAGLLDLVIVGAGPAGLSAALAAKASGLQSIILEQGSLANTIRRYPNRKIVMAEPVRLPLYGSLWISDAPKETLLGVWQTILEASGIAVNEGERVADIRPHPDIGFVVETPKRSYHAQRVILAIGKRGSPNELPAKGADLPKVLYSLTDSAQYAGCRILVVGGGDSAAEAAVALGKLQGTEVTLSYRRPAFTRLRDKNRVALEECAARGQVRLLLETQVREVRVGEVELEAADGRMITLANDYVFALLGGSSPKDFLEKIGVRMVTKELSMEGQDNAAA